MKITKQLLKEMIEEVIKEQTFVQVTRSDVNKHPNYTKVFMPVDSKGEYVTVDGFEFNTTDPEEDDFSIAVTDQAKAIAHCNKSGRNNVVCKYYAKEGWVDGLDLTKLALNHTGCDF